MFRILILMIFIFSLFTNLNASLNEKEINTFISNPNHLGKKDKELPIWEILDEENNLKAYIFESYALAPVLGFSGGIMNLLVSIDLEGTFLDIKVLEQDEPVFVSGLGVIPFVEFLEQYKGKSLSSNIKVAKKIGASKTIHIDGVSKATASVKIANDTILASAIKVAREKLSGVAPKQISNAKLDLFKELTWEELIKEGLVKHLEVKNSDVEELFKGSEYEDSFLKENPNDIYLDLWVANLGVPTIARNIISKETQKEIDGQITNTQEAILILANGPHQILSENFVRNTSPDTLEIRQDNFPISTNDGDYEITLLDKIPYMEQSIILDVDKRFNFDPSSLWILSTKITRGNTTLYSTPLVKNIDLEVHLPKEYFDIQKREKEIPLWLSSIYEQKYKLITLTIFLILLFILLYKYQTLLIKLRYKRSILLLITLFFIGWYGQGQLSMVTILGFIKSIINSQSLMFLLYDPFSLIIWFFVFLSLIIWGRGTFCGWLCPYGVLQEFSYYLARIFKIPKVKIAQKYSEKLVYIKYVILLALVITTIFLPKISEYLIEIEPFKTSITLIFDRQWPYVIYALLWLFIGMFIFKGFCRFICPLGAFLSLAGRLKFLDWLPRRKECGNPCNNCYKSCNYNAIDKKDGHIKYEDCFQCLDCVQIYSDSKLCKILQKDAKKEKEMNIKEWRKNHD